MLNGNGSASGWIEELRAEIVVSYDDDPGRLLSPNAHSRSLHILPRVCMLEAVVSLRSMSARRGPKDILERQGTCHS